MIRITWRLNEAPAAPATTAKEVIMPSSLINFD
jgi:hypothetical protein